MFADHQPVRPNRLRPSYKRDITKVGWPLELQMIDPAIMLCGIRYIQKAEMYRMTKVFDHCRVRRDLLRRKLVSPMIHIMGQRTFAVQVTIYLNRTQAIFFRMTGPKVVAVE